MATVKERAVNIKKLFDKYDTDGSGYLDREELAEVAKEVLAGEGRTVENIEEEVDKLVNKMDKDGDGDIGLIEFAYGVGLEKDIDEYRAVFDKVDADGNGYVDHKELATVLKEAGVPHPKREADSMLRIAQKRRGQVLTFDEFAALMLFNSPLKKRAPPVNLNKEPLTESAIQELRRTFEKYDADKSGFIDKKELKVLLKSEQNYDVTSQELRALMKRIDTNGDGQLSFAEFIEMMGFKDEVALYWQAFMNVDANQNGRIDKDELIQVLQSLNVPHPKKEARRIFKLFGRKRSLKFDMFVDVMLSY